MTNNAPGLRGRIDLLCMLSGVICVFLLTGLTWYANDAFSPLMWIAVFAACWYGSRGFWSLKDRRAQRCFGWMGFLFVLCLTLGLRLDYCECTDWDGLALALGVALVAGPAAAFPFARLAQWLTSRKAAAPSAKKGRFAATMALLFAAWLPALLAYYPGIHAYDTFAQIPEYVIRSFNTHHPLLHTLWVGWLYELGGTWGSHELGMVLYSIMQMLLTAFAVAYALQELRRLGCPRWVNISLTALFCLSPQYPLHAIGCTKDIPFAAVMLIFVIQLYRFWQQDSLQLWIGMIVTGALMCLLRNNASYALVLFAPTAVWCLQRGRRARMIALLAAVLVVSSGCAAGLKAATGAKDGLINEMFSVPAQQLARVYHSVEENDPVRYEILECVPYAQQYNERLSDPVKMHLAVETPQKILKFAKFWVREFFHYPTVYLDAFLYSTKGYWDVNDISPLAPPVYLWFYANLDMEQTSYLPFYKEACETWLAHTQYRSLPLISLLLQPAFYTWLTLFVLFTALWKRDKRLMLVTLCTLAYLATLLLGPVVCNRYLFCLMLSAPVLLGMTTVSTAEEKE